MAAAGFGRLLPTTVFEIVKMAIRLGVLIRTPDGSIKGAYHHPLLALARQLGIDGEVVGPVHAGGIVKWVKDHEMMLASVDLAKIECGAMGHHLVLVHAVGEDGCLVLHDCSGVLGSPGNDVQVEIKRFERSFNGKGLRLRSKEPLSSFAQPSD